MSNSTHDAPDGRLTIGNGSEQLVFSDISAILSRKNLSPSLFEHSDPSAPQLSADLNEHAKWLYRNIYSVAYPGERLNEKIARLAHGLTHVSRVACYIPVLANLYRKHNVPGEEHLTTEDIKLLQIAALFHDSAREDENEDKWDHESSLLLYHYLRKKLGVDKDKAALIAEATANKDIKNNKYFIISENEEGEISGTYVPCDEHPVRVKTIYHYLIHDGDCLDIIRARPSFDANYLDFYQLIAANNELAFEEMALLIIEARNLIHSQGDKWGDLNPGIKQRYEHENGLQAITNDIEVEGEYRILSSLNNELLPKAELQQKNLLDLRAFDPQADLDQENLNAALREGKVLARGMYTPSEEIALSANEATKGNKCEIEFKKTMRRRGIPTQSSKPDKFDKEGNPYRSMTMLFGSETFIETGLLVVNPNLNDITSINEVDIDSQYGKKAHLNKQLTPSMGEIETLYSNLLKKLKMGGTHRMSGDGGIITHNELLYRCTKYDALYFEANPDNQLSRARNLLVVFFMRNEYAKFYDQTRALFHQQHGPEQGEELFLNAFGETRLLPIFEYSRLKNTMKAVPQAELSDEHILELWRTICSDYLSAQLESGNREAANEDIEIIKIRSLYRGTEFKESDKYLNDYEKSKFNVLWYYISKRYPHGTGLKAADNNYPAHLQAQINTAIIEARSNLVQHFDEKILNDIESGKTSIFTQRNYDLILNNPDILERLQSDRNAVARYLTVKSPLPIINERMERYVPFIGKKKSVPESAYKKRHGFYNTPVIADSGGISFHKKINLAKALQCDVNQFIHNEIKTTNTFDLDSIIHMVLGDFEEGFGSDNNQSDRSYFTLTMNEYFQIDESCFFYDHINNRMLPLTLTEEPAVDHMASSLRADDIMRVVKALPSGALKGPFELNTEEFIRILDIVIHDVKHGNELPLTPIDILKKINYFLNSIEMLLMLVPESDFSDVMENIIKPALANLESEFCLQDNTVDNHSEYIKLFQNFIQRHEREPGLENSPISSSCITEAPAPMDSTSKMKRLLSSGVNNSTPSAEPVFVSYGNFFDPETPDQDDASENEHEKNTSPGKSI